MFVSIYLVADIVGAVRVLSAPASPPQLRHVSLVPPPGRDVTVSHKPTPGARREGGKERGREKEGIKFPEFLFSLYQIKSRSFPERVQKREPGA